MRIHARRKYLPSGNHVERLFTRRAPSGGRMADNPCPSCGKTMEQGFLVAENFVEGARWTKVKTRFGTGGDKLVPPDALGNQYIPGFRCTGCKLLLLFY